MMTKHEYQKQRDSILEGMQLTATPTVKSVSALIFSGLISTYGIYSILLSMGIEGNAMTIAIGVFIAILIVADTFKRGSLVKFYNSQIRKKILDTSHVLKMQLIISLLALSFMVVFDIVGSFATANWVEQKYQDFRATNSKEYELLEQNAQNGKMELDIYSQELTAWQSSKADAYANCDDQWKGWKAKYKAGCKKEWEQDNPKPVKPTTGTAVTVNDYQGVKAGANDDFLSQYIFYIILFLSASLTLLLQYTTISEINDNKDAIKELLTDMMIGILQDRLTELEANYVQHETQRNELISNADRREKELGRDFEERGKAIALLALGKAVDSRGKAVQRIANNEAFPYGNQKAGYVDFSFNQQDKKSQEKNDIYGVDSVPHFTLMDKSHKDMNELGQFLNKLGATAFLLNATNNPTDTTAYSRDEALKAFESIVNDVFIFNPNRELIGLVNYRVDNKDNEDDLFNRDNSEFLIRRLWDNDNIGANQKLKPKTKVINVNNRTQSTKIKNLYEILLEMKALEMKGVNGGYYSLVSMDEAIELYWKYKYMC